MTAETAALAARAMLRRLQQVGFDGEPVSECSCHGQFTFQGFTGLSKSCQHPAQTFLQFFSKGVSSAHEEATEEA